VELAVVVYACLVALVFILLAVNRLVLPWLTGWSLGRALFAIAVRKRDGSPVGITRWPRVIWPICSTPRRCSSDGCGRCGTAADARSRPAAATEVHKVDRPQRKVRRQAAVALMAATLLCAAGVA